MVINYPNLVNPRLTHGYGHTMGQVGGRVLIKGFRAQIALTDRVWRLKSCAKMF